MKLNGSSRGGHESGRNEDMPERPARRSGRGRTVGAIVGAIACLLVLAVLTASVAYALRRSHAMNIVEALRAEAL